MSEARPRGIRVFGKHLLSPSLPFAAVTAVALPRSAGVAVTGPMCVTGCHACAWLDATCSVERCYEESEPSPYDDNKL